MLRSQIGTFAPSPTAAWHVQEQSFIARRQALADRQILTQLSPSPQLVLRNASIAAYQVKIAEARHDLARINAVSDWSRAASRKWA